MTGADARLAGLARSAVLLAAGAPGGRSVIGGVLRCRPGESWPASASGAPMQALAEVDVASCPRVPEVLRGVGVLAVFRDPEGAPMGAPSGQGWVMREYGAGEGLAPLEQPVGALPRPVGAAWAPLDVDFPDTDDWPVDLRREAMGWDGGVYDAFRARHANARTHKVGGWPSLLQAPIRWPAGAVPVLQIAGEPRAGLELADGGIFSLARHASGGWFAYLQSY